MALKERGFLRSRLRKEAVGVVDRGIDRSTPEIREVSIALAAMHAPLPERYNRAMRLTRATTTTTICRSG